MAVILRRKVSLNKRRYQKDGFDLDLTYINNQIIAMGFPAVGIESLFRNPRDQVKKFLDKKHLSRYRLYNLCVESNRQYDDIEFEHRVSRFPFADHQAPPLPLMSKFCNDVAEWTKSNTDNVAAIHCKAGKGRAGMMICCYLMHCGDADGAEDAMAKYAHARTKNNEGVTIPSQRRYIRYYEDVLKYGEPKPPKVTLKTVRVKAAYASAKHTELFVEVYVRKEPMKQEEYVARSHPVVGNSGNWVDISFEHDISLEGDVKLVFFDRNVVKKKAMCHMWFNTAFVDKNELNISKAEIDGAWKDKKNKRLADDFQVQLQFKGSSVSAMKKLIKQVKKQEKAKQLEKKKSKDNSESENSDAPKQEKSSSSEDEKEIVIPVSDKKKKPKKSKKSGKKQKKDSEEHSD